MISYALSTKFTFFNKTLIKTIEFNNKKLIFLLTHGSNVRTVAIS